MPTRASRRSGLLPSPPRRESFRCVRRGSVSWEPMRNDGSRLLIGSCGMYPMRAPRKPVALCARQGEQALTVELHGVGAHRSSREQPEDGERRLRLARARFADKPQDLSLGDAQGNTVDDDGFRSVRPPVGHPQVVDPDDRICRRLTGQDRLRCRCGRAWPDRGTGRRARFGGAMDPCSESASRRPLPSSVKAMTVSTRAALGQIMIHGAL